MLIYYYKDFFITFSIKKVGVGMKKLFYKIELRLGSMYSDPIGVEHEEIDYYSDGYIVIIGDSFEGYLTDDYIKGKLLENEIEIKVYREKKTASFGISSEDIIEISEDIGYFLISNDNDYDFAYIDFIQKVNNKSKQAEIEKNIVKVKETRMIP